METPVNAPSFWEERWQAATNRSQTPDRPENNASGAESVDRWNKLAKDFAKRTQGPKASERRNKTIADLTAKGVLTPDARVLDIGAGPGAWALAMSSHCAHVTALEPSSGMTRILSETVSKKGKENISIVEQTWQETDLGQQGWEKAFDLVFASMTPGIDGPEALQKMMAASRRFCYMSAFSGPGMRRQFAPLWETLLGSPMPEKPNDIIYPFNLLYAQGYRPSLTFSWWNREINWDRDHALRHFINFFEPHLEITQGVEAQIADYVDSRCPNGEYRPDKPVCRGTLIWSVDKEEAWEQVR